MELGNYVQAFRKNRLLIALLTLAGLGAGIGLYLLTPAVFSSSVTFYVSTPLNDGSNPLSAGEFAQARVNSYVSLLDSEQLAGRVIADQKLTLTPAEVIGQVEASAQLNTVLVKAEVHNTSPAESLAVARGIANTFGAMVDTLDNQGRRTPIVVINVVSGPTLAPDPVAPSLRLYAGLGLMLGAGAAAVIAVLRELLDSTVRSAELAAALVRAPVLGSIAYEKDVRKEPLLLGPPSSSRGEAFRQLRTNLQFLEVAKSVDVLMVTSSVAREGRSTTAVNLALSFVELGHRVLLIEADLRRPRMSHYLGVDADAGLTDVLVGRVLVDDVIQPWGSGGLSVLPAGSAAPNPSELLGSQQMAELVQQLRLHYDQIILDTPPLLPVTDAVVCAGLVDGAVLVLRWGRTHRSQVAAAAGSLRAVDAQVLGVVLSLRKVARSERRPYEAGAGSSSRKTVSTR